MTGLQPVLAVLWRTRPKARSCPQLRCLHAGDEQPFRSALCLLNKAPLCSFHGKPSSRTEQQPQTLT